jgi:YtcA-like protein
MSPRVSSLTATLRCATCAALALTSGCGLAPSVNVLGSFFPAWLISIVTGVVLTVLVRQVFIATKIAPYLHPAGLVYPCLACLLIFATWLVLFGN